MKWMQAAGEKPSAVAGPSCRCLSDASSHYSWKHKSRFVAQCINDPIIKILYVNAALLPSFRRLKLFDPVDLSVPINGLMSGFGFFGKNNIFDFPVSNFMMKNIGLQQAKTAKTESHFIFYTFHFLHPSRSSTHHRRMMILTLASQVCFREWGRPPF